MNKYLAKITITLRSGILDVQGKTVERALHSIEFGMMSGVRIGKYVELTIDAENEVTAGELAADACSKLIANPIIEDYQIDIAGSR
ncbi:MAG: phosphoribosylformylglycinamidine synthase subunit PurS [Bacteroidota bacterium]|nr:phosphoribosylformylglycinamidine synthase subunit PurS [Bacteroidota bacterium]